MPDRTYDLVALGTGTAASKVAKRCRAAGWRVAVVDDRAFGGTCALRGCEPKKTLRTIAAALDQARRLAGAGLVADGLRIDWPALMAFKRSFTDPVPGRKAEEYAEAGIDAFQGHARFAGPDAVEVEGAGRLRARHVLIATGAKPAPLPIEGAELLQTSDDFLDLDQLPRRIVLVGGGYISFEFAHIAARAGAEVTILHQDDRPLAQFDQDLVGRLVERTRELGVKVELGAEVKSLERAAGGILARTADGRIFEAAAAFHGSGRLPNIDGLDLEAGQVETEKGRLKLDKSLRSVSNPAVHAAGDAAASGPPLTPVASHDADCVAANLLEGGSREPDYAGVTSVVFTIPPLTAVGPTEEQAREQGLDVEVHQADMAGYQSERRVRETAAGYKVLVGRGGGKVVGAHLLGRGAEETINVFALAVRLGLKASDLGRLLSAYPSGASNIEGMLK